MSDKPINPLWQVLSDFLARALTPPPAVIPQPPPNESKINEAFAKAQGEFPAIPKTRTVDYDTKSGKTKFSYADLADVLEAVKAPLARHGLSIMSRFQPGPNGMTVIAELRHSSGEKIVSPYPMAIRTDARHQDIGSAITYARRYSISALLGIAAEEDDDANIVDGRSYAKGDDRNRTRKENKGIAARKPKPDEYPDLNEVFDSEPTPALAVPKNPLEYGDYKCEFGKKYLGKKVSQVSLTDWNAFIDWLESSAVKKGVDAGPHVRKLKQAVKGYYDHVEKLNEPPDEAPSQPPETPFNRPPNYAEISAAQKRKLWTNQQVSDYARAEFKKHVPELSAEEIRQLIKAIDESSSPIDAIASARAKPVE